MPASSGTTADAPAGECSGRMLNEAAFGYRYIAPYVKQLPAGSHVLEIGCGAGLLLARLAKEFPLLRFSGVEPAGPGFDFYKRQTANHNHSYRLHEGTYETFNTDEKFALIFLVNVLQYLPDVRHFFEFAQSHLAPGGKCLVLCSNHGFPYEEIFGIPFLGSKRLTYMIFQRHILDFEKTHHREGLWANLNFIKWSQVNSLLKKMDMPVVFHPFILTDMIERFDTDPEFAARQKRLAWPAKLIKRSGLLAFLRLPVFWRIYPYMFLEIGLKGQTP